MFQEPIGLLKLVASKNILLISVTLAVFQYSNEELYLVALQNVSYVVVT